MPSPSFYNFYEDQRKHMIDLLFPEYWAAEANSIIDAAIREKFSLGQIAEVLTKFGVETLILNTYDRQISRVSWHCARP